ncbi:NAD-dependent protein deacylase sirtuin-5, mitochondrial-like [Gordionus sp. m RMFG-2023]|uniref:NAD-dependent protein deacylase sirtuin-5, mitochondrial-like n=1 Tax=Gordionus sp. m RMFG-2023 TaxID=3053472 RepID=UPI0031FE4100
MNEFKKYLSACKHLIAITGAGISAESGIPTFRGEGGIWKKWSAQELATPQGFKRSPKLVWQFYHYRRELVNKKFPNQAHLALASKEKEFHANNRKFTIITQNIDELHHKAGSKNVIELHGSLYKVKCTICKDITANYDSPICEVLKANENFDQDIDEQLLPRCQKSVNNILCNGLLRPYVVWFGENLDTNILNKAYNEVDTCDLCLLIGTSSQVYPAAMFAPRILERGVPVAEFNLDSPTLNEYVHFNKNKTNETKFFFFEGSAGKTLPELLS